jgi:adenylate kinase
MFSQVNVVRSFTRAFASKVHRLIISGAPASGKGTQCEKIIEEFKVPHLSTGDMLRAAVKAGSPLGKEAKAYMDAGKLVPDSLVINLVKEKLATPECVNGGWLLDGFPRTGEQAKALQQANINPDKVILLDVPDAALIERVTGRRTDPETGTAWPASNASAARTLALLLTP